MQLICPSCQSPIPAHEVNIQADIAKCVACENIYKASRLMDMKDLQEPLVLPAGSKIKYHASGEGVSTLVIPSQGLKGARAIPVGFAMVWICFIAFWTWGASQSSVAFALFSIPFWLVGFLMWFWILKASTEVQTIWLERDRLAIRKKSLVGTKDWTLSYTDIHDISLQTPKSSFMTNGNKQTGNAESITQKTLTLSFGVKSIQLAEYLSEAETTWLHRLLESVVYLRTKKKV